MNDKTGVRELKQVFYVNANSCHMDVNSKQTSVHYGIIMHFVIEVEMYLD